MRRPLLLSSLLILVACGSQAESLRIDAFGQLGRGNLEAASDDVRQCSRVSDEGERFLCASMLGEIETLRGRWRPASEAFQSAFATRDRIAAREHYGSPSASSLYQWAYADVQLGRLQEANATLARAVPSATEEGDDHLELAAMTLLKAEIEERLGNAQRAAALRANATSDACTTDEIKFFEDGDGRHGAMRYLPTQVWLDLGDACSARSSGEATVLYRRARSQAKLRNEAQLEAAARAKPGMSPTP